MRALIILSSLLSILTINSTVAGEIIPRSHIMIVGSSTAFPIVSSVAERFKRSTNAPSPVVISMGTGGGFKLFCSDKGAQTPDITMASRRLKPSERELCKQHSITEITELKIGYDGIAFTSSKDSPNFSFRMKDIYLALAREVPSPDGEPRLVANPYQRWNQIDPSLPDIPIRVLGPPPTSGTRDILVEKLVDQSCQQFTFLRQLKDSNIDEYHNSCYTFREDGAYINSGENDSRIVRKLADDNNAVGIIGYNFLDRNRDVLKAASIDDNTPEYEKIEDSSYLLTRPLYIYVNQRRIDYIPNLHEFLLELTSDASWGEEGYLVDHGLIPLTAEDRESGHCQIVIMKKNDVTNCSQVGKAN